MKIALRLWFYMLAVVVLVLSTVWIFQILLLPDNYFKDATKRLESLKDEIVQVFESENLSNLTEDKTAVIEKVGQANGLRIELKSQRGERLFFYGAGDELLLLSDQEIELISGGDYITKRFPSAGYGELLVIAQALRQNGEINGILIVSTSVAPIEDTLSVLTGQLILVIVISFLLATVFALLVSGFFVRPIREIERVAKAISQGHYDQKVRSKDSTELGALAETINDMSEQLGQIEELRRAFIATVSHQFKTPLSIIQGHTELLADMLPAETAEKFKPQISVILEETAKLNTMAHDVLSLSKIQAANEKLRKQPVLLESFCKKICDKLSILDESVVLNYDIPSGAAVWADADSLSHVVENIVQNAYCHAQARNITVKASGKDGMVTVCVKDDGIGVTPEQQERIWDRFYKGDSKNRAGSGLGMSIVKEILDGHHAKYGIISNGTGTEVWFELPTPPKG